MASVDSYFNIDESFAINDHDTVKIMQQSVRDRDSVSFSRALCLSISPLSLSLFSLPLSPLFHSLSSLSRLSLVSLSLSLSSLSHSSLSLLSLSPASFHSLSPPQPPFIPLHLPSVSRVLFLSLSFRQVTHKLSLKHTPARAACSKRRY